MWTFYVILYVFCIIFFVQTPIYEIVRRKDYVSYYAEHYNTKHHCAARE